MRSSLLVVGLVLATLGGVALAKEPKPVVPRNDPGRWSTRNDYPDWLTGGEQVVAFELTIDTVGSISDCRITESSGSRLLDNTTCSLLRTRARFKAARDADGNPTQGTYTNRVRWISWEHWRGHGGG